MIYRLLLSAVLASSFVHVCAQVPEAGHTCVSGCGGQTSNPAQDARRARQHREYMKRQREWDGILRSWQAAARKGAGYSRQGQKELAKGKCAEALNSFQRELAAFQSVSTADLNRADGIWGLNKCIKEGGKTHCYGDMHLAQEQRVGWARDRIVGAQSQCAGRGQTLVAGNTAGSSSAGSKAKKSHSSSRPAAANSQSSALSRKQTEQQKRDARVREWTDHGRASEARSDLRDAIRDYKKAAEASPGNAAAQENLARAQSEYAAEFYRKGDYKNAVKYYGEAARTSPSNAAIAANLRAAEEAKSGRKGSSPNAANGSTAATGNLQQAGVTAAQPVAGANGQAGAAPATQNSLSTPGQPGVNAQTAATAGGKLSPFPATGAPAAPSAGAAAPAFEVKPNASAIQQLQAIAGTAGPAPGPVQGTCRENCLPPKLMADPKALGKYKEMEAHRDDQQKQYQVLGDKLNQISNDMHAGTGSPAELARQFSEISSQRTTVHADIANTETQMNSFLVSFQEGPAKPNGEPDKKETKDGQPK
ncbi:MAG TPA: hypothetical protein VKW06_13755 [Candidatus Angelobacter sp.]|nr:hypothetical protein [Candidatus Angelobacter sp.]